MTTLAATANPADTGSNYWAGAASVRVKDTYWGYTIEENVDRFDRESMVEAFLRFLGLVMVLTAYGQWLMPGTFYVGDVVIMKAGLSFMLGAMGVSLYWYASCGNAVDMQVDLARRQLRVVKRNSRGQTRLHEAYPMDHVEGAYLKQSGTEDAPCELFLRLRGRKDGLLVAKGAEDDLMAIHRRLSSDLRPVAERIDHRLAKSLPFRSQRGC